jgi:hypothetical protein
MAVVRLGPSGEVEVLVPPTPEEVAEGEAALVRFVEALARVAAERDWAAMKATASAASRAEPEPPR